MLTALLNHLWQSTLFALGIALLVPLVRHNGAHVRYWLWWAASVKFLVPFAWLTALGEALHSRAAPVEAFSDFAATIGRVIEPIATPLSTRFALALLGVWALGFVVVLAYWLKRALLIRSALSSTEACKEPWAADAQLRVKQSDTVLEPGVIGIFKPVLLVPRSIATRLPSEQLRAIVAHELCH